MTANPLRASGWGKRARRALASALLLSGAFGSVAAGCLNRPINPVEPRTTSTVVEKLTQSSVDKIDLLLAIDNSRSMADKQEILALAIPDLVSRLVNPVCIDPNGVPANPADQPTNPKQDCPPGTKREFKPVLDIHIGIISSSLGGHGSDACPDVEPKDECSPADNFTNNDKGRLLCRKDSYNAACVETYQEKGFLAWDPDQKLEPPGEADIEKDTTGDANGTALVPALKDMVIGTGQVGCGFEAQNEAWYRFLVDPEPYEKISLQGDPAKATPEGIDQTIIAQRADFLRPDSLLAIIMLSDENDCSIKESGQFYLAAQGVQTAYHLPPARSECKTDPTDECCKSCGQAQGGCPDDPACAKPALDELEDNINLRCYDQKRRFGIDFLYPIDRYTKALTEVQIPRRDGTLDANPIFSDLNHEDENSTVRDPGLVFLAGIVGVPWQDIARNPTDLTHGFKNTDEMNTPNDNGETAWDLILGDPDASPPELPTDPLMQESIDARTGSNPVTGDALVTAANPGQNPINGHEWTITNRGDLQYACIFPLPTSRKCNQECQISCDCMNENDNPLCDPNPEDQDHPTLQTRAKAYPGLRHLAILKGLNAQGIVASVCPAQLDPDLKGQADYGYRPAIGAIVDRLKSVLGGQCLPRTLTPDKSGQVPCLIIEARTTGGKEKCEKGDARIAVTEEHQGAVEKAKADNPTATWDTFCEIPQLEGSKDDQPLWACQNDTNDTPVVDGKSVDGWCYVDGTTAPPTGNPELVASCDENERRLIRFVGKGEAAPGATLFITCSGE